jgi:hypothetical protein
VLLLDGSLCVEIADRGCRRIQRKQTKRASPNRIQRSGRDKDASSGSRSMQPMLSLLRMIMGGQVRSLTE